MVDDHQAADLLLAQALWAAEQADFYDSAYNGYDRSDDSDYAGGGSNRKRKRHQQKKGRNGKQATRRPRAATAGAPAAAAAAAAAATATDAAAAAAAGRVSHPAPCQHSSSEGNGRINPGTSQQQPQQQEKDTHGDPVSLTSLSAAAAAVEAAARAGGPGGGGNAGGRRRRKDCGQQREKGRAWSAAEEAAFLAGLEQHGRDWHALAAAIDSRDSRAVASHAQKHFIRLCMAGAALPAKVAESGAGYTLSGRPLDPGSAAAAAYGFRLEALQRLTPEQQAVALSGILAPGGDAAAPDASGNRDQKVRPAAATKRTTAATGQGGTAAASRAETPAAAAHLAEQAAAEQLASALAVPPPALAPSEAAAAAAATATTATGAGQADAQTAAGSSRAAGAAAGGGPGGCCSAAAGADLHATLAAAEDSGQTAYAAGRPRREAASGRQRLLQLGSTSESLELLACRDFVGPVGCGAPSAQPFSVEVELQVLLVMEVHVHLSSCEVIGLLGGAWDEGKRCLAVTAAFPCRRAAGSAGATSVELDPGAEVEARSAMDTAGLRPVGWYHSHPSFPPSPSRKDVENQRNYQALTRDTGVAGGGPEPFIGFILGPFDPAQPQPLTTTTAFLVQHKGAELLPFNVKFGMTAATMLPPGLRAASLRPLLAQHKNDVGRTDFCGLWRPFTVLCPASLAPLGPPLTRLDKLLRSLRWRCSHVADRAGLEAWLQGLVADIEEIWELSALQQRCLCGQQKEPGRQLQEDD